MRNFYRPRYRVNQYIRIPEVQLIDETGKPCGIVSTIEALRRAQEVGLDLVEVNPTERPSLCKIMDWGQFQYKQKKMLQAQKVKAHKVALKGIRLSLKIGEHDRQVRLDQSKKFLNEGHHVRLEMILRGREKGRGDLAREIMQKFVADLGEGIQVESPLARQGGNISMQVVKKAGAKAKEEKKEEGELKITNE